MGTQLELVHAKEKRIAVRFVSYLLCMYLNGRLHYVSESQRLDLEHTCAEFVEAQK